MYADDLILTAQSEESLRDKTVKWKSGLEAKRLKMNTRKNEGSLMFSCSMKDKVEEKGKWPIRRELAIIRFCATVARNGFINDVVE